MTGKLHGPYTTDPFGVKIYGTVDTDGGGQTTVLDIRGWGYLTGHGAGALGLSNKEGAEEQIDFAKRVVEALNAAEAK